MTAAKSAARTSHRHRIGPGGDSTSTSPTAVTAAAIACPEGNEAPDVSIERVGRARAVVGGLERADEGLAADHGEGERREPQPVPPPGEQREAEHAQRPGHPHAAQPGEGDGHGGGRSVLDAPAQRHTASSTAWTAGRVAGRATSTPTTTAPPSSTAPTRRPRRASTSISAAAPAAAGRPRRPPGPARRRRRRPGAGARTRAPAPGTPPPRRTRPAIRPRGPSHGHAVASRAATTAACPETKPRPVRRRPADDDVGQQPVRPAPFDDALDDLRRVVGPGAGQQQLRRQPPAPERGGEQGRGRHDEHVPQLHDGPDEDERHHVDAVDGAEHLRLGRRHPGRVDRQGREHEQRRAARRAGAASRPSAHHAVRAGGRGDGHAVSGTSSVRGAEFGARRQDRSCRQNRYAIGAQQDRQHVGQPAEDQDGGRDLRALPAGRRQPGDQRQLDDAQAAGGEGDGGQQPGEGEDGQRLHGADLVRRRRRPRAAPPAARRTATGG